MNLYLHDISILVDVKIVCYYIIKKDTMLIIIVQVKLRCKVKQSLPTPILYCCAFLEAYLDWPNNQPSSKKIDVENVCLNGVYD